MNRLSRLTVGLCALFSLIPILGVIAWTVHDHSWLLFCSGIIFSSVVVLLWAMQASSSISAVHPAPLTQGVGCSAKVATAFPAESGIVAASTPHGGGQLAPPPVQETWEQEYLQAREKGERLEKSLKDCHEKQSQLIVELNSKNDEILKLRRETDELKQVKKQLQEQIDVQMEHLKEELRQKEHLLEEYQYTIQKQQRQLAHLESKTRDLSYEIETLVMLNESSPSKGLKEHFQSELSEEWMQTKIETVRTAGQANIVLKRCLALVQELFHSSHHGSLGARFREVTSDNDTLDLRRLFDRLRHEEGAIIVFYSPRTEKLLFAHPSIRETLGWSPDKFLQNFPDTVIGGIEQWKKMLDPLQKKAQIHTQLKIRHRSGAEIHLKGCFASISEGVFAQQVLGVIYETV